MRPEVAKNFLFWSSKFEGATDWLYPDAKGLVTTGIGDLADPVELAYEFDWVNPDKAPASRGQVLDAWMHIKAMGRLGAMGGGHFSVFTTIRATQDSIARVCARKLASFESQVSPHFDVWDDLPWQAQLCVLSMAWAMGGLFLEHDRWPGFRAAVNAGNWTEAAKQCQMSEASQNSSFHQRNLADAALMLACMEAA